MMDAKWMWLPRPEARIDETTAYMGRFRSEFELAEVGATPFPLSISADSRYRLFVNGGLVATGPLKPTTAAWFVDTVDIGPQLRRGANVVAVEVLCYANASSGNVSIRRAGHPALSIAGALPAFVDVSDTRLWRCAPCPGRTFLQGTNTVFLGIQEQVDGLLEPHGWLDEGFDDSTWETPAEVSKPDHDVLPRTIPQMTLDPIEFVGVSRHSGKDPGWARLLRHKSVTINAHERVEVDLDIGALTTAFVTLQLSGGTGTSIELTAAECYENEPRDVPWLRLKGDRTDAVNGDLYGDPDRYRVAGRGDVGAPEIYSPFWFRTARYLRIAIQTDDRPLTLQALALTETHYPLVVTGAFRSSSHLDSLLWETSVRTLRNCMHETFEDCPFYEQLQYAMDTRSQALFALHLSSDDRLVRRAIADFALSGDPQGLTESRAPSIQPQVIPGFSLFWIFMLAEHLDHVGDQEFTRQFLERVDAVLTYFDRSLADDGFVLSPPQRSADRGQAEVWNFVDWTDAWGTTRGVPNLGTRGANTILTFQYVAALASAERTALACGEPRRAARYQERSNSVLSRLRLSSAWDANTRYFRDSDEGEPESQHAQVWAVLAGAVTGPAAADLLSRAIRDPKLTPCSYAMSHSLFDAVRMAGAHDLVDWKPWEDMLALNLTTWAEDTVSNRSDCHAWGSVPLYHFPRWVLGVTPHSPGFAKTRIDPAPSNLEHAEGTVPTPHGPIHVRWEQRSPGVLSVTARGPATIEFVASRGSRHINRSMRGGEQTMTFEHVGELSQAGTQHLSRFQESQLAHYNARDPTSSCEIGVN